MAHVWTPPGLDPNDLSGAHMVGQYSGVFGLFSTVKRCAGRGPEWPTSHHTASFCCVTKKGFSPATSPFFKHEKKNQFSPVKLSPFFCCFFGRFSPVTSPFLIFDSISRSHFRLVFARIQPVFLRKNAPYFQISPATSPFFPFFPFFKPNLPKYPTLQVSKASDDQPLTLF